MREQVVRKHLAPRLGRLKLSALNALHVESLYADLRADGVGGWTVRTAADLLGIALNYGVRLKLIASNPARLVAKPVGPKRDMICLDDGQARDVRVAASGKPTGPLVITALGSGCRQGELLGLAWPDLDLSRKCLTVRRSLAKTRKGFALKEPKTKASCRTVALPGFVVEALTAHKVAAMAAGLLDAPVFCTRTGGHLDRKNVLRAFRAIVRRANKTAGDGKRPIPVGVRFHDLRHTAASLLLSSGESLRAVAARLGHSKPTMTLAVYAHVMPMDDWKLADRLEKLIA